MILTGEDGVAYLCVRIRRDVLVAWSRQGLGEPEHRTRLKGFVIGVLNGTGLCVTEAMRWFRCADGSVVFAQPLTAECEVTSPPPGFLG